MIENIFYIFEGQTLNTASLYRINMKKSFLALALLLLAYTVSFAQKDYIYRSIKEAKKNPDQVYSMTLNNQKLNKFPKEILKFKNLRWLILKDNKISSIPDGIGNLTNLEVIDLSDNQITKLPSSIKRLTNLRELSLPDNNISTSEQVNIKRWVNPKCKVSFKHHWQ